MQYIKITFSVSSPDMSDMLIAMLADAGYNGFEEYENKLLAYIEAPQFLDTELQEITDLLHLEYEKEIIPAQNWNALWESNFEPVIVDDYCTIRAHFHDMEVATTYDIVITPKMSFGTGHHATTQLMIKMMRDLDLNGKQVLDFGTGTGVLAILAEKLGAAHILAIDNDEWSVDNAQENIKRNDCKNITVQAGSLEDMPMDKADVALANINRHILLKYMQDLYQKLADDGIILMSGLLATDKDIMLEAAANAGFHFNYISEQANWIAMIFNKKNDL